MTTETRVENWKAMMSNPKMRPEFRAQIASKLTKKELARMQAEEDRAAERLAFINAPWKEAR